MPMGQLKFAPQYYSTDNKVNTVLFLQSTVLVDQSISYFISIWLYYLVWNEIFLQDNLNKMQTSKIKKQMGIFM